MRGTEKLQFGQILRVCLRAGPRHGAEVQDHPPVLAADWSRVGQGYGCGGLKPDERGVHTMDALDAKQGAAPVRPRPRLPAAANRTDHLIMGNSHIERVRWPRPARVNGQGGQNLCITQVMSSLTQRACA